MDRRNTDQQPSIGPAELFAGPTAMHAACREVDWANTALGPVERWPTALWTAVRLCLDSPTAMAIWAGPELVLIYNDGYSRVLGADRHPWALGRPGRDAWGRFWAWLGPELARVVERGESIYHEDQHVVIPRDGRDEETYFTYSHSPLRTDEGEIIGSLNVVQETTAGMRRVLEHDSFQAFALDTAQIGVWELDLLSGSARRSLEHDRIFGYAELLPEWTYAMFLDHVLAEDREQVDRSFRAAREARSDWNFECRIRRRDGELRWIWAAGQHRFDTRGQPRQLAGIVQDITERRTAELALRESEARLRTVLDNSKDGINMLDLATGKYVFMSPAQVELTGFSPEEMANLSAEEAFARVHPDDREISVEQQRRIAAGEDPGGAPVEYRWKVKGGEYRWFSDSRSLVREPCGRAVALVGISRDITDRKRAEQALRESEERYRSLFNSIDEGFCIIEVLFEGERPVDYRFCEINPAFERHTGLADATGQRIRELLPALEQRWFDIYGRVARTGEPIRFQQPVDALGRFFDVFAFRIGAPEQRRVAVLFNDISERTRAEQDRREADRRKDEYLAMLGHELRNPLAAIRHATELLELLGSDDPRVRRTYAVLDRQSAHMARIIDGLLDISRIARGKINLELARVDLRDVARRVVEDLAPQIAARGLTVETALAREGVWVDGDDARLVQVLDNLVGNALKFTPAPGRIEVTVAREGDAAVVRVRDTGVGIRRALLDKIFDSFQQEAQDIARSSGGLGLGLALARGLVELHHGSISAHSEGPDAGAEFVVRLPLAVARTRADERSTPDAATERRVLVIEDHLDAAEMLRDLLELLGHDVEIATNGKQALERLRRDGADVVLCDLGLPGISGYEVARAVRSDARLRATPLVAISGYGQPEDRRRTAAAGFDAHLTKPVDAAALHATLARVAG